MTNRQMLLVNGVSLVCFWKYMSIDHVRDCRWSLHVILKRHTSIFLLAVGCEGCDFAASIARAWKSTFSKQSACCRPREVMKALSSLAESPFTHSPS